MKHIGVLAHSFEGATLCFRTCCLNGVEALGAHMHPEITMTCSPMAPMLEAWDQGDYAGLRAIFANDVAKLARAECDFFVCPDNTAHLALESKGERFALPGLHIAEVVADEARLQGYRKIAILGTRFTMDGPVYPDALGRRGIGWAVPADRDRSTVDEIIFGELCLGLVSDQSREAYRMIIERMAETGCDAVALVCTEIPLLVTPQSSCLPILDSTRLLAAAAVRVALGEQPMPTWRGGPVS